MMRQDDDLEVKKPRADAEIGGDISTWSIGDIDERIQQLETEIGRLRAEKDRKQGSLSAAEAFFKSSK